MLGLVERPGLGMGRNYGAWRDIISICVIGKDWFGFLVIRGGMWSMEIQAEMDDVVGCP